MTQRRRRTREATADEPGSARLLRPRRFSAAGRGRRARREPGRLARPAALQGAPGKARSRVTVRAGSASSRPPEVRHRAGRGPGSAVERFRLRAARLGRGSRGPTPQRQWRRRSQTLSKPFTDWSGRSLGGASHAEAVRRGLRAAAVDAAPSQVPSRPRGLDVGARA